ncbi:MAG: FAD-dependent oxidoreductase [Verrucomicrobiota bacterium]
MKKLLFSLLLVPSLLFAEVIEADLLIVGGNESACAAAVQAARLGVKRIVLVNDIQWLGGQFSAEGVGCPDEWTVVNNTKTNFPRSGLFLEVLRRIRAYNSLTYGKASPGNAFCGTETIEPAAAAKIFEELVEPYVSGGALRIERGWQPLRVLVKDGRVTGAEFEPTKGGLDRLQINARLTMDASDWGDVVRLSGAKYGAGPDLKSRFGEASAPESFDEAGQQEMNPISWCMVLRETGGKDATIEKPESYHPLSFVGLDKLAPWVDSDMSGGIYSPRGNSPYTHRRLVDRWHNGFALGTEATFLNYPTQDYPLCQLPQRVVEALEKLEPGSSKKNIVELTPALRRVIFEDVKQHALGMLYHLQTAVHDRVGDFPQSFRYLKLTDEFGTADHLPPKPYIREGLRLEALYMLREQDIRAASRDPMWAKVLPTDGVFGYQFNIDFHPTRRGFVAGSRNGPWRNIQTPTRGWHTDTDRSTFPLRGLVPVEMNGLIGAGKNIGVSSVVQSAIRLHGQMMHVGQAGATLAWLSLRDGVEPRVVASDMQRVRELQLRLVRGVGGPGVLLWPWHDLTPDDLFCEAANMLAVRGIWQPEADSLFFNPERVMTRRELARVVARVCRALPDAKEWVHSDKPLYTDVAAEDPDRAFIEGITAWGSFQNVGSDFKPEGNATRLMLAEWLKALGLPVANTLTDAGARELTRSEAAQHLWRALQMRGEWFPSRGQWLQPGGDDDGDGRKDYDDPLPFDRDNNNIPDRLQAPILAGAGNPFGRRVLVSDYGGDKVAIVSAEGRVEWQYPASKPQDVWMLANGNVLFSHLRGACEVTLAKEVVWQYESPERTEVHGCQPLPDGNVMVVECGTRRLVEVDRNGKIAREIPVPVKTKNTHDQLRGCRRTLDGRYLISAKGDRAILELNAEGKVTREIKTPGDPHEVRELPNGNLLIACGEGEALLEVDRDGKVVWKLGTEEVPNNPLRLISGFQRLPDGHTIVVNWLGHGYLASTAQFFELDEQKRVVRECTAHGQFTSINKVQLLDVPGDPARGEVWR